MNAIFDVDYTYEATQRHQSRALGFQDQEGWTILGSEERSVRIMYVSTTAHQ